MGSRLTTSRKMANFTIVPPSPPNVAAPPLALGTQAAAPPPDALCFAGMIITAFVPLLYASRAAEEPCDNTPCAYERVPIFLLAAYVCLCAAYSACTFAGVPLGGDGHAFASSIAYVAAAKHALRLACDPSDGPPPRAADAALFAVAAGASAGGAARFARPVQNCSALFAGASLCGALFAARLARRWAADAAPELAERRARRRALITLGACALSLAAAPACGACSPGAGSSAGQAFLDALVLGAATDALC